VRSVGRTLSLTRNLSVTLNGSGNGVIQLGPSSPGEVWLPASTSISCTGSLTGITGISTCFIYAGSYAGQATFVDSTYNVLGAASSLIAGQSLYPGQYVFAVFTNGPPNQTASLVVSGTRQVP
jgi:hypothetical protein